MLVLGLGLEGPGLGLGLGLEVQALIVALNPSFSIVNLSYYSDNVLSNYGLSLDPTVDKLR